MSSVPWPTSTPPLTLVLSGPSGAGKSTLLNAFLAKNSSFQPSVSATTRQPRPGEVHGEHYFFLSAEEFEAQVQAGAFAEHACVFGANSYGTPKQAIIEQHQKGISVIMDIDLQGARQLRSNLPAAIQIFILPPSPAELEQRLRGRGTEEESAIASRLETATKEMMAWPEYDYCLINDDLDETLLKLEAIVQAEQQRCNRLKP